MNKKIYIWTIVISLLLLIPACIWNCNIMTILSGIGCSGIAAAIMAIFLDMASLKRENERKAKTRAIYFRELKEQLKMMIERILWFDERLNENFDWDKDPAIYSTLQYMLYAGQQYPGEETISFEEAEARLNILKDKYALDQQSKMQSDHLQKVQKMFMILAASGITLLSEANSIKECRVELDAEDYMSLKEIESMCFQISLGVSLMCKANKNYGAAIQSIVLAYKTICKAGNYTDKINIGLHGTIKIVDQTRQGHPYSYRCGSRIAWMLHGESLHNS